MIAYVLCFVMGGVCSALVVWGIMRRSVSKNPKPARSAAVCIDRLRLEKEELKESLSRLMYWMDKAREGQEIDLERFNAVWEECGSLLDN